MPVRLLGGSNRPAQHGGGKALLDSRILRHIIHVVVIHKGMLQHRRVHSEGGGCQQQNRRPCMYSASVERIRRQATGMLFVDVRSATPGLFDALSLVISDWRVYVLIVTTG